MTIKIPHLGSLAALKHADESRRLEDLRALTVLDTASEQRFDRFTELVATVLDVPLSAVSFVDKERQWFKAKFGFELRETPRELGFCQHAILEEELMVVEDAKQDARFAMNPMVLGEPGLRFYAGAVIRSSSGRPLGTCCAFDTKPRSLSQRHRAFLMLVARMVETELKVRRDVAALKRQIQKFSLRDSETGLPNLELFTNRLNAEVKRADAKSQQLLLSLIRVDRFDTLEAALGRDASTYLMSKLAGRIRERLDPPCFLAHAREDRLALLTRVSNETPPQHTMQELIQCSSEPIMLGDHPVPVGLSVGASIYPTDADDADSLLKRAGTALWSRPLSEKSGYQLYQRQHSDLASGEFRITTALQHALDNDEFHLVYQPKIDIGRSHLVGAEALIRWNSPTLGAVPPGTFIPIAEKSDKIVELGSWVLAEACRQVAAWSKTGHPVPEVSINVTNHQIRQHDFLERIETALNDNQLMGCQLNVEITESSMVDDLEGAVRIMKQLRMLGIKISIDDFGTGFSSLSYLRRMPIQVLKIDRSFIKSVATDREDMKLVRSIVSMGHDLELDVVAEGVETKQQLTFLQSIGCDQVQGYIFSRPLTADAFAEYIRAGRFEVAAPKPRRSSGSRRQ